MSASGPAKRLLARIPAVRRWADDRRWLRHHLPRIEAYLEAGGRRLQLGTGGNILSGWLNTDLLPAVPSIVQVDAAKPLPFPSDAFDFVFFEHVIEHVDYETGLRLLGECRRILAPAGVLRIATPDLRRIASVLDGANPEYVRRSAAAYPNIRGPLPGFVVNSFFRDWGHQFIYDRETLEAALREAGFGHVAQREVGDSPHAALRAVEGHGEAIGTEDNVFETLVLEAW